MDQESKEELNGLLLGLVICFGWFAFWFTMVYIHYIWYMNLY